MEHLAKLGCIQIIDPGEQTTDQGAIVRKHSVVAVLIEAGLGDALLFALDRTTFYAAPMTLSALLSPRSVPRSPFSQKGRPASDTIVTIVPCQALCPTSWANRARPRPNAHSHPICQPESAKPFAVTAPRTDMKQQAEDLAGRGFSFREHAVVAGLSHASHLLNCRRRI